MKKVSNTEVAIENLVAAACAVDASAREKHIYREALRSLVRLAKSELMLAMKKDVYMLSGGINVRRSSKAVSFGRHSPSASAPRQDQLEFPWS
jgi:hypothetical protein